MSIEKFQNLSNFNQLTDIEESENTSGSLPKPIIITDISDSNSNFTQKPNLRTYSDTTHTAHENFRERHKPRSRSMPEANSDLDNDIRYKIISQIVATATADPERYHKFAPQFIKDQMVANIEYLRLENLKRLSPKSIGQNNDDRKFMGHER